MIILPETVVLFSQSLCPELCLAKIKFFAFHGPSEDRQPRITFTPLPGPSTQTPGHDLSFSMRDACSALTSSGFCAVLAQDPECQPPVLVPV